VDARGVQSSWIPRIKPTTTTTARDAIHELNEALFAF